MSAAGGASRWRPEVVWFADAMERKLRENDHKRHWLTLGMQTLSMRLTQEREELRDAVASGSAAETLAEAADVANFAMMIADKVRKEALPPGVKEDLNG
jgi:NTP pyrophosphatase (non-canonical NTP hydrolase)